MPYNINHVHLKTKDPKKTADWWVKAFNLTIVNDAQRPSGDRFISCKSEDGLGVNISGARTGDKMGPADGEIHFGLEHFGLDTDDIEAEIKRLEGMGAVLQEGPTDGSGGIRIAFLKVPDDIRIELIQRS